MLIFFLCLIIGLTFPQSIKAENINFSNNKYGIHLAQPEEEDIKKAAELVNSNGGDWGYITLVIQENDRDLHKWQAVFDLLRKYHLIPIIRLATKPDGDKWRQPKKEDAEEWAGFLNSLNWVVKNRYVILFNEPNHSNEWGGKVDIESYIEVADVFSTTLKSKNTDFFIMLAGFDASAPSSQPLYEDEYVYLQKIFAKISPQEFEKNFDGWSSHSYPNPAFSGSAWDSGRKSIRGYQWELNILKELGVNKDLPVFITETGWSSQNLSYDQIADYFQTAYENVWLPDKRVVAVTPFVLNYQGEPFLQFSWKMYQSSDFYPQYQAIKDQGKTKGNPEISEKGNIKFDLPRELVEQSFYHFRLGLSNSGQGLWDKQAGYKLELKDYQGEYLASDISQIEPFDEDEIDLFIKTTVPGKKNTQISLTKNNQLVLKKDWQYEVLGLPSMDFTVELLPKMKSEGNDLEIQVFDNRENLVFRKNRLSLKEGKANVDRIQNIILDQKYRVVLLKPYYLPRQSYIVFHKTGNAVKFKRMLPLDFNADGQFSLEDFPAIFKNYRLFKNLLP